MSLQVAILKVLASYPDGKATLAAMKADLAILSGAGRGWSERLKRLEASVPGLSIFGQGLVSRDETGWTLTTVGRDVLRSMEAARPITVPAPIEEAPVVISPIDVDLPRARARRRAIRRRRGRAARLLRSA